MQRNFSVPARRDLGRASNYGQTVLLTFALATLCCAAASAKGPEAKDPVAKESSATQPAEKKANPATEKKPKAPGLVMDYGPFLSYSVVISHRAPAKSTTKPADTTAETDAIAPAPAAKSSEEVKPPADKPRGAGHTAATHPSTRPAAAAAPSSSSAPELVAAKGITIKVGPGEAVCFDADLMRFAAGWTGGFLNLAHTNIGASKGDIAAQVDGVFSFRTRMGPGWSSGEKADFTDPRPDGEGPLTQGRARYSGLYRHGDEIVLSYTVGDAKVLDLPGSVVLGTSGDSGKPVAGQAGPVVFTRTLQIQGAVEPLHLLICDVEKGVGEMLPAAEAGAAGPGNVAVVTYKDAATLVSVAGAPKGSTLEVNGDGRVVLNLPSIGPVPSFPSADLAAKWMAARAYEFKVAICNRPASALKGETAAILTAASVKPADLSSLCQGGPALWKEPVVTAGSRGASDDKSGPYVVDTIHLPDANPWRAWMRPGGFDFFPDGRCVVCTMNGDVWIVSGLDGDLQHVSWKRFATGLYEPLGLKVVDGLVYVLGRDQITRLHDLDGDGEADFYENFNNDYVTLPVYHAFTFDLQTDKAGNFWFVRGGNWVKPGERDHSCVMKVSRDGKYIEQVAHGLRAPNGDGIGPDDQFVCGDNEGHWTPACRINLIKPGGFYGYVTDPRQVNPGNAALVKPHDTYDPPICWVPMNFDNSTGGQVFVAGDKWGLQPGQLLSTSYGKCTLYEVIWETTDGIPQGGAVRFPLKFDAGIMRGRFSPADGQLYVTGLRGWQTNAAKDGCLQRVRYIGGPVRMPIGMHVKHDGIEIDFADALDPESANDEQSYSVEQWNYRWSGSYGSPEFKVSNPKVQGHDQVTVKSAKLLKDGKSVLLEIPGLAPVMQMSIECKLDAADKKPVKFTIYNTINKVPDGK